MQSIKIGFSASLSEIKTALANQPSNHPRTLWAANQIAALEIRTQGVKSGTKLSLKKNTDGPDSFVKWKNLSISQGSRNTIGETLKSFIENYLKLDAGVIEL